jgi:prepilin-type N-terminal cleavage/methylation domain-containing protein
MRKFFNFKRVKKIRACLVNGGFTLIEVIISIALFVYIMSTVVYLYVIFNGNVLVNQKRSDCSSFSKIMIQKLLTTSDFLEISTSSDKVSFKNIGSNEYQILQAENSNLYLIKSEDILVFSTSTDAASNQNKKEFQLSHCGGGKISFQNHNTTIFQTPSLINSSKCIDLKLTNNISAAYSTETICALY